MAYDDELKLLHKATLIGKQHYQDMLEQKANDILFRHEHPVKWLLQRVTCIFDEGI